MIGHYIALKSKNGKFLSKSSNGKLICDKKDIKDAEILIMKYEGRYVTFKTKNGKYISAVNGTLEADKDKIGSSERFEIEWLNEDWFALKSNAGTYASIQKDGKIDVSQKNADENAQFSLIVKKVESLFEFLRL